MFEFLSEKHIEEFEIKFDKAASINCFSKVNGANYINNKLIIYLATNLNLDLIIQSSFWLLLISFIPKSTKKKKLEFQTLTTFLLIALFYLHFKSEQGFYLLNSKLFSSDLSNNYLLYSLLLTIFLIIRIFNILFIERFDNFISYLPFMFVFVGSYNSLNLNFYLIIFSFIGLNCVIRNKKFLLGLLFTILVSFIWSSFINSEILFFDVDKLNGFSSSAYNFEAVYFWNIIYYLVIIGFVNLIKKHEFDLSKLKNNFLLSGSLLVLFSLVSASSSLGNFLTYYYLGLQKPGRNTFESVQENAWRGISSSAESVGEYYGFVILLSIVFFIYSSKFKFTKIEFLLLLINIYGLYKSNNFAAFTSLVILILIFVSSRFLVNKQIKLTLIFGILIIFPLIYFIFFNTYSYETAGRNLIQKGLSISYVENLDTNEWGLDAVDQNRYLEILKNEETKKNLSSSLTYLIEKYHYSERNFLPNITTLISVTASPINRAEKWGTFFGKYNPNYLTLLIGTGLNNISDYYLSHPTKANDGLILPHSSLFSYLIFIGILGLSILTIFIFLKIYKNKNNLIYIIFLSYFLINLLKNDTLMYLNSFLLFLMVLNFEQLLKRSNLKHE